MVGWGLLLFSVWGYTKLISRPVWQGMRMWFNCSWLKVLLPRPTSGESSGWPPPCIIFFGVSSIATKALFIEETKKSGHSSSFIFLQRLQVSMVERQFETRWVLSGEIQGSLDIPWMNASETSHQGIPGAPSTPLHRRGAWSTDDKSEIRNLVFTAEFWSDLTVFMWRSNLLQRVQSQRNLLV